MTATEVKPSVTMGSTVLTSDSCDKAIVGTLEIHRFVIVIHVMAVPCTVAVLIRNGTISTQNIVDTVFLAISVLAAPILYRVACGAVDRQVTMPGVVPRYTTWP